MRPSIARIANRQQDINMKQGDPIIILPSYALSELKLEQLAGLRAVIVEIVGSFDSIKGCWVELPGRYLGEKEWYIPYNSIGI